MAAAGRVAVITGRLALHQCRCSKAGPQRHIKCTDVHAGTPPLLIICHCCEAAGCIHYRWQMVAMCHVEVMCMT